MLTTQSGQIVSGSAIEATADLLSDIRKKFDPDKPEMIDDFVSDLTFELWRQKIDVPDDGPEAMVGFALTGEVDFRW